MTSDFPVAFRLQNEKNTNNCFVNASVNAFVCCKSFREKFSQPCCSCECCEYFSILYGNDANLVSESYSLRNWVATLSPTFQNYEQQDPHEFISIIIDQCPKFKSLVSFETMYKLKCSNCRHGTDSPNENKCAVIESITSRSLKNILNNGQSSNVSKYLIITSDFLIE